MSNYVILKIMEQAKKSTLKHYLKLYKDKPNSQIFAPLADLYRKSGDTDRALQICQRGIKQFPKWALGYVILATIWLDLKKHNLAKQALEAAIQLAPENLLAHKLIGPIWIQEKNINKTLETYQMILYLDPNNEQAKRIVNKLNKVVSNVQDETGFTFTSLQNAAKHLDSDSKPSQNFPPPIHPLPNTSTKKETQQFDSRYAIIKSYIHTKDLKKAGQGLIEMKNIYGSHPVLNQKIKNLEEEFHVAQQKNIQISSSIYTEKANTELASPTKKQIQTLKQLLARVKNRLAEQETKNV